MIQSTQPEREEVTTVTKKVVEQPVVVTEHPQKTFVKKKAIFRTYQVIWYILGVIETLLAFRIALKSLGAYPFSGFTKFIYALSDPLALPFSGILGVTVNAGSVFEWSTFIAIAVYALIAYGIVEFLQFAKPVTPEEVEQGVDGH